MTAPNLAWKRAAWHAVLVLGLAGPVLAQQAEITSIEVFPPAIHLNHADDRQSVVVQATYADGITRDVTTDATLSVARAELVRRDGTTLSAAADGETSLDVRFGGRSTT